MPLSAIAPRLRVLIVDDNARMREILAAMLAGAGVRDIRQAEDGTQACAVLRDWRADLAFVDFVMRPMDGVAFTRRIRRDPNSPDRRLPIVMMTGHAERARVEEARDAGVNDVVAKPVTARAVLSRMSAVLTQPRPFVEAQSYVGPCRRRRPLPDFAGPWRRADDPAHLRSRIVRELEI